MVGKTRPYMALIIQQLIYLSDRLRAIAIPVGAGSPTIYAINQHLKNPPRPMYYAGMLKEVDCDLPWAGGGFLRLLIFAKYCR